MKHKKAHDNKSFEDHLGQSFEVIEQNTEGMPVKDVHWHGQEVEVQSDPIRDEGSGRQIVIRSYQYAFAPNLKVRPTKKHLITEDFIKTLEMQLWADGLEMVLEPRVKIGERGFTVFATARAKRGELFSYKDEANRLQDLIHASKRNS